MNTKFIMIFVVIAAIFIAGCGDDKSDSEEEQTSTSTEGTVQEVGFPQVPTNDVIVADDFSNLQINDITKPIYDNHTIWERQEAGLPMALPEIQDYTGGPDDKNTTMILDILKNYGIHATFYVCGNMVEAYPQVLRRIYEEGHAIGNHSYNHRYKELYPSTDNFLRQISDTDEIIKSVIGVRPLIIRTPGGRAGMWTPDYEPLMTACGYVEHDWNVSVEDATAKKPTPQEMIHFVDEQTNRPLKDDMALILMHSNKGKENTAAALPGIIKVLVDKGYKFGVVTPMTPQPW